MMTFQRIASALAVGAMLIMQAPMARAQGPDPAKPFIQSLSYSGTGCPQGTVGLSFANNRLSFTMIFDSMVATSGPNVPPTEATKNCQVSLQLSVPAGMSIWAQTTSARGYASLPEGQGASVKSETIFSKPNGDPEADEDGAGVLRRTQQTDFAGPVSKDYLVVEGHNYVIHAECGAAPTSTRTMVLKYTVNSGTSPAATQMTLDSLDGALLIEKVKACKGKDK